MMGCDRLHLDAAPAPADNDVPGILPQRFKPIRTTPVLSCSPVYCRPENPFTFPISPKEQNREHPQSRTGDETGHRRFAKPLPGASRKAATQPALTALAISNFTPQPIVELIATLLM